MEQVARVPLNAQGPTPHHGLSGGSWLAGTMAVEESMERVPNGGNLRIGTLVENCFTRSTGNAKK